MKFCGKIGFWLGDVETSPDIWKPQIEDKPYFGDVLEARRTFQNDGSQNEKFTTNNQISVLSDLYMQQNWGSIRYVEWCGIKWKVTNVAVGYPRITLTLGGEWNDSGRETDEVQ